jgi:hypothetical protein
MARALGVTLAEFFSSFDEPYGLAFASPAETGLAARPSADVTRHCRV